MDPICVDRVFVPACDGCVPLAALAVGSVEAVRSPHLPADPASDTVVTLAVWRTGAVVLGVGVTGPSHPVCLLVTTIMSLLSNSGFTSYSVFLTKRHRVHATGLTPVVLLPRLITYLCCYLLDQNGVQVRTRNNTGHVESSFDQLPSVVSQSRFCTQGLCALAQVTLAYLVVSGMFCFPGITLSTISPGLVSKYPGRAPKGALFVWRHSLGLGSRIGSCLEGFWVGSPTRALRRSFIRTHSQRETWGSFHVPWVRLLREF